MEKPGTRAATSARSESTEAEAPAFKVTDRRYWASERDQDGAGERRRDEKPSYVQELEKKLAEREKLIAQYVGALRRTEEEKSRYLARIERENAQALERERGRLVVPLFAVLDSFERSVDACQGCDSTGAILEGLTLVKQQFINALAGFGVAPIDALGQPFDPSQHEAVMTSVAQSSAEDGQVVEVFRTGYRTDSQVLRPSLVKVARLG